jgi:hypothetical protein
VDVVGAAEEALGAVLPPKVAGYVSGPLRSLAEHIPTLGSQSPEAMAPKTVEASAEKPPVAKSPSPDKPPLLKGRDPQPYR